MITLFNNGKHKIETSGRLKTEEEKAYLGTVITPLAYSLRIGDDEADIEAVAETDAEVRVLIKRVDRSPTIDLANPVVIAGLALLVSKESLPNFTQSRMDEILNNPVLPHEI